METDTANVVADVADGAGTVAVNSVNTAVFVLAVVLIIVSIVLCIIILLQSKRSAGLGAVSAVSSADTYWSRNKGNSMEGALERYTKIGGALFMIIAFIINLSASFKLDRKYKCGYPAYTWSDKYTPCQLFKLFGFRIMQSQYGSSIIE